MSMKSLYLDIFSGISGDMLIGALIDLGVDFQKLEAELDKLGLHEFHLHMRRAHKQGIEGVKFDVHLAHEHSHEHTHEGGVTHTHPHSHHHHEHDDKHHVEHAHHHEHSHEPEHAHAHGPSHGHEHEHGQHHHEHEEEHTHGRNYAEIKELISRSTLSPWVKDKAIAVFHRIAVAEGQIHGLPPEKVHFHEVGAVDSIVDIVGACIGLEMLGKPRVLSSNVVEGTGFMHCAHGRFPIPAPATLEIFAARSVSISQCEETSELVTPTGAALLAEFVETFGPMQGMAGAKIGFGLGTRDNRTRPNVLRAILGETSAVPVPHDWETDRVAVLETNLDNINSEILGNFVERAFASGALDVFHTPVQMKKNRPGVVLTVLCAETDADKFSDLIFRETTAFGVRRHIAERRKLRREFVEVKTPYGSVAVKIGKLDGKVVQSSPEYESCRKVADAAGVPIKAVYEAAKTVS